MKQWILIVFLGLIALSCAPSQTNGKSSLFIETEQGDIEITVEVVSLPEERAKGLMFREHLLEKEGMWFVFEESSPYSFWMKNTLIPLDIVYVNEGYVIVDIIKADPCQNDPCAVYTPKAEARYVLEINQNASETLGIEIGDIVSLGFS